MFSILTNLHFIHFKLMYVILPFHFLFMSIKLHSFDSLRISFTLKIKLQVFRVASAFFRVADEICRFPAYFDAAWLSGQSSGFEYGRPGFKSLTRTTEWDLSSVILGASSPRFVNSQLVCLLQYQLEFSTGRERGWAILI